MKIKELIQPNIASAAWLLVIPLTHVNNEKEQVWQKDLQKCSLKTKIAAENLMLKPKLVLKEIRRLRKANLHWNERKDTVRERHQLAKIPTCGKKQPRKLSLFKSNKQTDSRRPESIPRT